MINYLSLVIISIIDKIKERKERKERKETLPKLNSPVCCFNDVCFVFVLVVVFLGELKENVCVEKNNNKNNSKKFSFNFFEIS